MVHTGGMTDECGKRHVSNLHYKWEYFVLNEMSTTRRLRRCRVHDLL